MIALAALIAAADAPAARFAPPVDRPFRYTIVETRTDNGVTRSFTIERRLVFRRDGTGFIADVALARAYAQPTGDVAARFVAGVRALAGLTLRFHLDSLGKIVAIDELDAVWEAMVKGAAPLASAHADPIATMRALSPEGRRAVVASILTPVITLARPPGTHPVRVPAGALPGKALILEGTESIVAGANGMLHTRTEASGNNGGARIAITRSSDSDPAQGLVRSSRETQRIALGNRTTIKVTTVDLILQVR